MATNLKTACACAVLGLATLAAGGCGSGAQSRIVGKWEAGQAGAKMTAEFTRDGKATITMLGQPVQGTYKLTGDELEWTLGGKTTKCKVKVTATELEMTGEGNTITYKRL